MRPICRFKSGGRSNLNLQTKDGRPVGAADLRDLASQVEMVAGARNQLYLLFFVYGLTPPENRTKPVLSAW